MGVTSLPIHWEDLGRFSVVENVRNVRRALGGRGRGRRGAEDGLQEACSELHHRHLRAALVREARARAQRQLGGLARVRLKKSEFVYKQ